MANIKDNDNSVNEFNPDETLIKRTLMVAAYPALISSNVKDDGVFYKGFLPGFTSSVEDLESEDECVEYLQDILDDEVENLVCLGKSLPYVEEDENLLKEYPDHKIVYLDINVYATKEELEYYDSCAGDCASCAHKCGEEEFYDEDCDCCCDEGCNCEDYEIDECDDDCDCGCGHHHEHHHHHGHNHSEHHHHNCGCKDDCDCGDDNSKCDCNAKGNHNKHKHNKCCRNDEEHKNKKECNCKDKTKSKSNTKK